MTDRPEYQSFYNGFEADILTEAFEGNSVSGYNVLR